MSDAAGTQNHAIRLPEGRMEANPAERSFGTRDADGLDNGLEIFYRCVHGGFIVLCFEKGTHDVTVGKARAVRGSRGQFAS